MVRAIPAEPQPGGRPPAPGELAVVQAFLNTFWDLAGGTGSETLLTPADLGRWLEAHGLAAGPGPGPRRPPLGAADLERALDLREGLRGLLFANNGEPPDLGRQARLDAALATLPVRLALSAAGARVAAPDPAAAEAPLAELAAIVARAMPGGDFARLKACPGPHCGWAFYDHSRNGRGRWCSMSICGSRVKARTHYRRTRGTG